MEKMKKSGRYDQFLAGLPAAESTAAPVVNESPKTGRFDQFLSGLPIAGSVIGGLAGTGAGAVTGPGAIATGVGGAALGGAAGEAARQLIQRARGKESPTSWNEAAGSIGKEGAIGAIGELSGLGIGRAAAKAYKVFPKFASTFSGSPAVNFARAQKRGFGVFTPGVSREAAGKAQELVEAPIVKQLFSPEEQVLLKAKDAAYADELMRTVMLKQIQKVPITAKEAVGLRILAPVKRAADTMRGISKNIELDKAARGARGVIAEQLDDLSKALGQTERSITASQLRMPLRVNKTNPNQISGLTTTMGPMLGLPALAATIPFSPLAMALGAATMGTVKRAPKLFRRGVQRTATQALTRELGK